jgi:DNA-binding winged helix-turn-helix (wHTH) protein/TolB-like protein
MAQTSLKSPSGAVPASPERSRFAFGPFTLDLSRDELLRDGEVIALRRKTFDLLVFLASRPGEVLAKDRLMAAVWPDVVVTDDSLTQCVYELRAALGDAGSALIHTVPRRGYRFDADVQPIAPASVRSPAVPDVPAPAASADPQAARATSRVRRLLMTLLLLGAVVGLATVLWTRQGNRAVAPMPPLSIVLLPLESQDAVDPDSWFADALTAELTAELGRIASVLVISRDTAATYRGMAADPREVSRTLGVRYVVRGTVRRSGDQVRLVLAMIDGESGAQHWAQSFNIERSRLDASLEDIVQQIARRLSVQMYRSGGSRATALSPQQVQADDLAMQG